ncbi:hypothetical protein DFJ77DRAFT_539646 [Powellomyces hirtus]|nr:hypothetical protein DFJ77DRAFT_539646 [Powellomyces hirtus]
MGGNHPRSSLAQPLGGTAIMDDEEARKDIGAVGAMDLSPHDMANTRTNKKGVKIGLFGLQVPFPVLLITLFTCIIAIIVVPNLMSKCEEASAQLGGPWTVIKLLTTSNHDLHTKTPDVASFISDGTYLIGSLPEIAASYPQRYNCPSPQLDAPPPPMNYSSDPVGSSLQDFNRKYGDGQWNFASIFFHNPTDPTKPSHVCTVGSTADLTVNPYLSADTSENGLVLFFDTLNGMMLAASDPHAVNDATNGRLHNVFTVNPSRRITMMSKYLQDLIPVVQSTGLLEWASLGTASQSQARRRAALLYCNTHDQTGQCNTFAFIVAFPRDDFFKSIDQSICRGVILIISLSVAGVIAIASILIILPLRALGKRMKDVTQMQFSSLEKGALERRSFVREIAHLEDTFFTMVKSFAAGIRMTAGLMDGITTRPSTKPAAVEGRPSNSSEGRNSRQRPHG